MHVTYVYVMIYCIIGIFMPSLAFNADFNLRVQWLGRVVVRQGNHSPGKPGKLREFQSGQGKVRENGKSQGK